MTDFYMHMFGRPSPGRAVKTRRLRYVHGAPDEEVSRASSSVDHFRRSPVAPMSMDEARARERRFLPQERGVMGWRSDGAGGWNFVPVEEPVARTRPLVPENPGGYSNFADFANATEELRTSQPEAPAPEPRRGLEPPSASIEDEHFWTSWHGAETRARQRWEAGAPTPYDMLFTAIYGKRDRLDELHEENEDLRERARR